MAQTIPSTGWSAVDLADTARWTVPLAGDIAHDLVEDTLAAGHDLASAPPLDRSGPVAGPWIGEIHRHLDRIGLALLDGFPVAELGGHCAVAFWRLASLLGEPLLQNLAGQRIDVVRNEGTATVRGAKTDRELIFHTDFANTTPDVFGLLTVRQAREGGDSLLVSVQSVERVLRQERPEVLAVLGGDFFFDRTGDVAPDDDQVIAHPVLWWTQQGARVLYNRARIHRGHRVAGVPLSTEQVAALDALDDSLNRPELVLRTRLRPGQAIFIDNGRILHSRSAFTDWSQRARQRELLRVWLSVHRPD
jgi:hypothetical protein